MNQGRKTIQDSYDILEDIGKGGMAHVYKAVQVSLNRTVAIKEIKPSIAASDELVERFKREARTSAGLVHENIIQVYNFGEPKKGSLFIVMEYVDGLDLKTLFRKAGTVPPRIAAIVARDVARALAYAHSRGLVHRDVKPGNIMISSDGDIKLMDFGIVREMDSDLTRTGAFLGTPSYMSPEQFLGEQIKSASDIFSLGVVLFEVLSGKKPFAADNESSLSKKVRTEKEPKLREINPAVPRKMQAIIARALKKDPRKRWESADDMAAALSKFIKSRRRNDDKRELADWVREVVARDRTRAVDEKDLVLQKPGEEPKPAPAAEKKKPDKAPPAPKKKKEKDKKKAAGKKAGAAGDETRMIESPETAETIMKWAWRAILVLIIALAAVVMFLVFNPGSKEKPDDGRSPIEKVIDRFKTKK